DKFPDYAPDKNRKSRRDGKISADGKIEGIDAAQLHCGGKEYTDQNELPVEIERKHAANESSHKRTLRSGKFVAAYGVDNAMRDHIRRGMIEQFHRDSNHS